jgi:hypothetical protein
LPAYSADRGVLNEELPHWMTIGVQSRWRLEGHRGENFAPDSGEDFLLLRHRLLLGLKPSRFVQFQFMGQDSRSAGIENPGPGVRNTFDLREAYVTLGEESAWWRVQAGRQRTSYGTERLIGAAEWANTGRVFDLVKLSLQRGKNSVDVFSASVVENDTDNWDHHVHGNNLHGVYGSLGTVVPQGRLEPYVFYRTSHSVRGNSWTSGLRSVGNVGERWSYEVEAVKQQGAVRPGIHLDSWAALVHVQRHWKSKPWQPSAIGEFNHASGDKRAGDTTVNTFDQLYPTNHGIYGIVDQVGRRNTRQIRGGIWMQPRKWLTVKTEGHAFWLASRYDGLYNAPGAMVIGPVAGGATSTHVGSEFDAILEAKPNTFFTIGAQYGHFFSGDFIKQNSGGVSPVFYAMYLDFRM